MYRYSEMSEEYKENTNLQSSSRDETAYGISQQQLKFMRANTPRINR
jgi:hypothetical protein